MTREFKSIVPIQAPAGSVYSISGPCRLQVIRGAADAVGKPVVEGESIFIPENKKVPFEFEERSEIRIESDRPDPADH